LTELPVERLVVDELLVRRMLATQFPEWRDLPIRSIVPGGWDNRIFRLGEQLVVRLPSAAEYSAQVEKEHRWLPVLAPALPLPIPTPLAIGAPTAEYPWRWSIRRWIEGETAAPERIGNMRDFAASVAKFLVALHGINAAGGPQPGAHNFNRGGSLATYDSDTHQAIAILRDKIDVDSAKEVWDAALETRWAFPSVWIHGDISPGNLLVRAGRLNSVIDFGMLGVGDPACDLSIAWTLFRGQSRQVFRDSLSLDAGIWLRARAWTLWKALIVAARLVETSAVEMKQPLRVIEEVLG
jgi:aminoglycoside phosphotransferase (APT) family kinase protein